jgi:hypothetical protein
MEFVIVALVLLSPVLVFLGRIVFIPNGIGIDDLLRRTDLEWPRGVQEEEPVRWHVERLQPRSRS